MSVISRWDPVLTDIPRAPKEEPGIVELTPVEVEAILVALIEVGTARVARKLKVSDGRAHAILNDVYKKLKDD